MGLLALHGYLTPSQPPERALQEQIAGRVLALHVIICIPCPHNHCYSGSHDACVLSYATLGSAFREHGTVTLDQPQLPTPCASHCPRCSHRLICWVEIAVPAPINLCLS